LPVRLWLLIRSTVLSSRWLLPTEPEPDGTHTCLILVDPRRPDADYTLGFILNSLFSAAEAREMARLFSESLAGPQRIWTVIQARSLGPVKPRRLRSDRAPHLSTGTRRVPACPTLFMEEVMSLETTRKTVEAYAGALVEGGDYARFFTDDVVFTIVGVGPEIRGREAVKQTIDQLHTEAFDLQLELRNLVFGDTGAAVEANFIGTHKGEFAGIPATHRRVDVPYSVIYDLDGEKISALRIYMPMHLLFEQLGVQAGGAAAAAGT
jgi:predicted ester cyclase